MGLKKYEIITVGSDKRVRALRSWQVGDRYVNIGDVGGIVYDEKTLSQDGACWMFKGNFGFPGARIGGDSIVDVGEAELSATGAPAVDILGSSVVVGSKLQFGADQTAADFVVLTANDFEQGDIAYLKGANWETWKSASANHVRSKTPIFMGGVGITLKLDVPGYAVQAFVLDRDGIGLTATAPVSTGEGVTLAVPAGQYMVIKLTKDPIASIVPADATAAQITFTGTFDTKLSIIDSRVEINPANATGTATIKPGGTYAIGPSAKYPEAIIRNSKVSVTVPAEANRVFRFLGQIIGSTAVLDGTAGSLVMAGTYSSVKSLQASGVLASGTGVSAYDCIRVTDCDNFAVSPTIFPGLEDAQKANMPFIFQGCNVPNGRFYHHTQVKNTYVNIDFAKAQADLGKTIFGGPLVSSEVEGLYRLLRIDVKAFGALVESYESVKSLSSSAVQNSYGTTIYKDAYFNGLFGFEGTNVFGNKVRSHPLAQVLNVQPRAVNGIFNATSVGGEITGIVNSATLVCVPNAFRVNSSKGLTISNLPTGYEAAIFLADANDVITRVQYTTAANTDLMPAGLVDIKAFIRFKKSDNTPITPEDLAGVTVTVYNGCKIVNTGESAVNMKGNIRVEDNATLVNASITGSGYFGGNSVMSGMSVNGYAYMKDNTLCANTPKNTVNFAHLRMTDNSVFISNSTATGGLKVEMKDNAKCLASLVNSDKILVKMEGESMIAPISSIAGASTGVLLMKDRASIVDGLTTVIGDITFCGEFLSNVNRTWTGKRVIYSTDAPTYDNNVKTQYDF